MDKDKIVCCDKCLAPLIAQDDRTRTVRAFVMHEKVEDDCRCGHPALFELSR